MGERLEKLFSEQDRERIKNVVDEAEGKTSGEIVPYVVQESDPYAEALWRGGTFLGVIVLASLAFFHEALGMLPFLGVAWILILGFAGFVAGVGLVKYVPAIKRQFAGEAVMERRVSTRAAVAFIDEEVFNTRDRTGILIFVSMTEHKVLVMGDSGINARVGENAWEEVAQKIVRGIREGRAAEGLIEAVEQCGHLLEQRGVAIRPDDRNELPDHLRIRGS
jgi:putative membrane protein